MEIKKALTFRASSIGDCLMGKYLLENVHMQYPDARLGIVIGSRGAMIRDLFSACPWLEVIEANRRSPSALWQLWKEFHGSDYVVTQYAGKPGGKFSLASKLFARILAKKGGLIGFTDAFKWNEVLYDRLVPIRADNAVAERDRDALRVAGLSVPLRFPILKFVQDDSILDKFNLNDNKFVIIHLFAGGKGRSLSSEKGRELLTTMRNKLPHDVSLVISGAADDRETAVSIAHGVDARVIAGEASLQEMINLIKSSQAVVSVDTGMAHITAQLGKPLFVMSTCLGHNWWFPGQYGAEATITLFSRDEVCTSEHIYKDYPACINAIDMNEVASRVVESDSIAI